ncbi:MAG: exo-alpha-sialidase [Candidatus Aminicenantes bacterium]|nr:exo-alpha-sialidase [Candidatus Aminicenantes bacterium]
MKKFLVIFCVLSMVFLFQACGGDSSSDGNGDGNGDSGTDNPTPTLTSITPGSQVEHMPEFTLTATGSDFVNGAKIVFNGTDMTTTFVSSTQLTCSISPDDIVETSFQQTTTYPFIENQDTDVQVVVNNPAPGGGDSAAITFTIRSNHEFLTPLKFDEENPEITVDENDNILVVCQDKETSGANWYWNIFFYKSTDLGGTWDSACKISNCSVNEAHLYDPVIAVDCTASTSGGMKHLSAYAGNIYTAWEDDRVKKSNNYDIYSSSSSDTGSTWSAIQNLSNSPISLEHPDVVVDSEGRIHGAAYQETTSWLDEIYYTYSENGSVTWTAPTKAVEGRNPRLAVDSNNNVYMVYQKNVSGIWKVFLSYSTDKGVNWSAPENISQTSSDAILPDICLDDHDRIFIVWEDYSYDTSPEIAFKCTNDSLTVSLQAFDWNSKKNLSNTAGRCSKMPRIAPDCVNNINVVWQDRNLPTGDIFYSRSIDSGSTWTSPLSISQNDAAHTYGPVLAVDSCGHVHVAWGGFYYARSKEWE